MTDLIDGKDCDATIAGLIQDVDEMAVLRYGNWLSTLGRFLVS